MIYYIDYDNIPSLEPVNACIGYFDGVHRGHQQLLQNTVNFKKENGHRTAVITFDKSAAELFSPDKKHPCLTDIDQKIALFEKYGIDDVYIFHFDQKFASMDGKNFEKLLNKMNVHTLTCGTDFSYGDKGSMKASDLLDSKERNFLLEIVEIKTLYGKKISSTRIRNEVEKGNIRLAERLSGHPLTVKGEIRDNHLITANVVPENGTFLTRIDGNSEQIVFQDFEGQLYHNDGKVVLEIVERLH